MNLGAVFIYLAARLSEASTWAGIATALVALHINLDPGLFKSLSIVGTGVGGLLAFLVPGGASTLDKP